MALDPSHPGLRVDIEPNTLTLIALHPNSISSANINLGGIVNGSDAFFSVTKAPGELSILAERRTADVILHTVTVLELHLLNEPSKWRALRIVGPLDLSMVGVLHEFTAPLKQARIPVFVSSTFLTDYILVGEDRLNEAVSTLKAAGWLFVR